MARAVSEEEALWITAAVERDSEHPVAQAVVRTARERDLSIPAAQGFEAIDDAAQVLEVLHSRMPRDTVAALRHRGATTISA